MVVQILLVGIAVKEHAAVGGNERDAVFRAAADFFQITRCLTVRCIHHVDGFSDVQHLGLDFAFVFIP